MDCPYIVMEVRYGIPHHCARENTELTNCLCEAWENKMIDRTYEGAVNYIRCMEREDRKVWIEIG